MLVHHPKTCKAEATARRIAKQVRNAARKDRKVVARARAAANAAAKAAALAETAAKRALYAVRVGRIATHPAAPTSLLRGVSTVMDFQAPAAKRLLQACLIGADTTNAEAAAKGTGTVSVEAAGTRDFILPVVQLCHPLRGVCTNGAPCALTVGDLRLVVSIALHADPANVVLTAGHGGALLADDAQLLARTGVTLFAALVQPPTINCTVVCTRIDARGLLEMEFPSFSS